ERRRLARAGRPRHEDDPVLERRGVRQVRRQSELLNGRNPGCDDAHHDREGAALTEDVHAEAAALGQREREVARALLLQGRKRLLVRRQQFARDARRVLGFQDRHLGDRDRTQFALLFNLRRASGREDQVADALARLDHGRDECVRSDRGRGGGGGGLRFGSVGHELESFSRNRKRRYGPASPVRRATSVPSPTSPSRAVPLITLPSSRPLIVISSGLPSSVTDQTTVTHPSANLRAIGYSPYSSVTLPVSLLPA